jgi:hypothetical protein
MAHPYLEASPSLIPLAGDRKHRPQLSQEVKQVGPAPLFNEFALRCQVGSYSCSDGRQTQQPTDDVAFTKSQEGMSHHRPR